MSFKCGSGDRAIMRVHADMKPFRRVKYLVNVGFRLVRKMEGRHEEVHILALHPLLTLMLN